VPAVRLRSRQLGVDEEEHDDDEDEGVHEEASGCTRESTDRDPDTSRVRPQLLRLRELLDSCRRTQERNR